MCFSGFVCVTMSIFRPIFIFCLFTIVAVLYLATHTLLGPGLWAVPHTSVVLPPPHEIVLPGTSSSIVNCPLVTLSR